MKIKHLTLLGLFVTLIGPMTSSLVGQSPLPRTFQELDQLAPEQRNELRQKKVRFEQLTEEQKRAHRSFNARLNSADNSQQLRKVMLSYTQWLLDLESDERQRILALPVDQRVAEVIKLVKQEKERRFKELLDTNLSGEDLTAFGAWYDRWLVKKSAVIEELGKQIDEPVTKTLMANMENKKHRNTIIVVALLRKYGDSLWQDWFEDWESDVTGLIGSMSETAQILYASAENAQQRLRLVLRWGDYSFVAQSMPDVSEDRLLEFYNSELTQEHREILDRQSPTQWLPMLRRFYFQYRMPEMIRRMLGPQKPS